MTNSISPYEGVNASKKEQVAQMFDHISGHYDFLNRFMSLGIDVFWRRKAIRELVTIRPESILDVATGTGDFAFEAIAKLKPKRVTGVDLSPNMLTIAREKIQKKNLGNVFTVETGDSEKLQFNDNQFDAITSAFGVRNFENLEKGLGEMLRVLKPGGKVVILELSNPHVFPVKQLFHFYFRYFPPVLGTLFSRDWQAYSYLPKSVRLFPEGKDFVRILESLGYRNAEAKPLAFGICRIYSGVK